MKPRDAAGYACLLDRTRGFVASSVPMLRSRGVVDAVVAVVVLVSINACTPDLGPCDMQAATSITYRRGPAGTGCKAPNVPDAGFGSGCDRDAATAAPEEVPVTLYVPYTEGQALAQESCGNGGVCHSAAATGALRHGAPAGLNFDLAMRVSPLSRAGVLADEKGHAKLTDWIETSWELIDNGSMPPGAIGAAAQAMSTWFVESSVDTDPNERFEVTPTQLPALSTPAGKEIMRNWLACGAPVVNGNIEAGQRGPDEVPATWDAIHEVLISGTCTACHSFVADPGGNGGLLLTDACSSWRSLVGRAPSSGAMCASFQGALVTPGDPAASLLMHKLDADPLITPSEVCGFPMPLFENRLSALDRESVRTWITNGAPPPTGCAP